MKIQLIMNHDLIYVGTRKSALLLGQVVEISIAWLQISKSQSVILDAQLKYPETNAEVSHVFHSTYSVLQ